MKKKFIAFIRFIWPFVRRSSYDAVRMENYTLRDVLSEANKELLKHRNLINALKTGQPDVVERLEAVLARRPK